MYFSILPDLDYLKYNNNPYQGEIFRVKNLFTRAVFSKFIAKFVTLFDNYYIRDGDRPDTIAYDLYGNSFYDWVIILCNERLVNFYEEWPKDSNTLEIYVFQKYGTALYDDHHFETLEVKKSDGTVILPAGIQVGTGFSFSYTEGQVTYGKTGTQIRVPVTNYDYEIRKNEEKRIIQLLRPEYLTLFENEVKKIVSYNTAAPNVLSNNLKTTATSILPTI